MKVTINNLAKADTFAAIFQHIKNFSDQINILFSPQRLYIQTMDSSRVSIVELEILAEWFDIYDVTANATVGISSTILGRILLSRDKKQVIELDIPTQDRDKFDIHFLNPETTKSNGTEVSKTFEKHFEIPLIDLDEEIMNIPDMEYQAEFSLPSSNFADIIQQLKMFGDTMDVFCSEEKIALTSNSPESGKMEVEIKIDDLTNFAINEGETLQLSYSLTYLHYICLYNKLAKEVEIKLYDQFPLQVLYKLGENANMKFFLAPKIDES